MINVELSLADLEIISNRLDKIKKKAETTKDKDALIEVGALEKAKKYEKYNIFTFLNEEEALKKRRKTKENVAKKFTDYLLDSMKTINRTKIDTPKAKLSIRNNAESVFIEHVEAFVDYCMETNQDDYLRWRWQRLRYFRSEQDQPRHQDRRRHRYRQQLQPSHQGQLPRRTDPCRS